MSGPAGLALSVAAALAALSLACGGAREEGRRAAPAAAPARRVAARPASPGSRAVQLSPGAPVERPIASGEEHAYELDLAAGRYLSLAYRQIGIEVEATLERPDGGRLAAAGRGERRTLKRLAAVIPAAGRYRLRLAARDAPGVRGRYRLSLEELRPSAPGDGPRVAARSAFAEGLRIWQEGAAGAGSGARARLDEARRLWRAAGDSRGAVDAGNEIGNIRSGTDLPGALGELRGALAEAQRIGYRAGEAKAWDYLGAAQFQVQPGGIDEARADFTRSYELWVALGDLAEQSEVASNLGYVFYRANDNRQASDWLSRGLEQSRTAGDFEGEANTLNALGLLRQATGDIDRALSCFRRARALSRRTPNRQGEASMVANEAQMYQARGQLQEALDLYNDPVLVGSWVEPYSRALYAHNAATLHYELGQLGPALDGYRKVLELLPEGRDPSLELQARADIGLIAFNERDYLGAIASFQSALNRSVAARDARATALALHSLGVVSLARGEPRSALAYFERALDLRRKAKDVEGMADTRLSIGNAYRLLGDWRRAAASLQVACGLAEAGRPIVLAGCLKSQAKLESERGDLDAARRDILRAIDKVESLFSRVQDDPLRASFLAGQHAYYEVGVDVLAKLDRRRPGQGYAAQALALSENARARGLLDLIAEGRIDLRRGIPPELRRRQDEITRELAETLYRRNQLRAVPGAAAALAPLRARLEELKSQQEKLASDARRSNPRYARVRYPKPLDPRQVRGEVQGPLDRDTALLEYSLGEDASHLFVVTRERIAIHRLPPAREIEPRVASLLAAVSTPSPLRWRAYRAEAAALYRLLLPSGSDARRDLLIAPDGILHLLPFEVLLTAPASDPSPARLPYLLRRGGSITYVPSASVLAELREPRAGAWERFGRWTARLAGRGGDRFLAFADPVYEGPPVTRLAEALRDAGAARPPALVPLPSSRREVERIAELYGSGARLYLDRRATKRNVLHNPRLEGAERVHFATHGILDEEEPALSGLALTPEGPGDDGMLRVSDIFNLSLNADLVVLSACETGRGKRLNGEGLVGLSRAFFYAGAPSLAVSLWPVPDDSTADLMVDFYRRLARGDAKGEALRQAKLAMVGGENPARAHPFYWAPFVLVGDPR